MDKEINNNGYEYVDLDLPSGTLWATMNVGASKPSDYGLYFQWGDTSGYTKDQVGLESWQKKFAKDWNDYKWNPSGDGKTFTKYTTYGAALELEDDAAHVHMGGDWHMPTPAQIKELTANTTSTWTTQDGVNGRLFTSKTDTSKSIFIPAAGYAWDGSVQNSGGSGFVWSSMLGTDDANGGQGLYFYSGDVYLSSYYRYGGLSVRGVIDKKRDNPKDKKNNMNKDLNLVEILKDVPKGTKLWSPVIGDCEFVKIDDDAYEDDSSPIRCKVLKNKDYWNFRRDGSFARYDNVECVLFPSKENRDWSTFKAPEQHKHFEPYQKVLVKEYCDGKCRWTPDYYCFHNSSPNRHYLVGTGWAEDDNIIPYEGNEDKVGKAID